MHLGDNTITLFNSKRFRKAHKSTFWIYLWDQSRGKLGTDDVTSKVENLFHQNIKLNTQFERFSATEQGKYYKHIIIFNI